MKSGGHKMLTELLNLFRSVCVTRLAAGQPVQIVRNIFCRLNRRPGRCLVPGFRNRNSSLVSLAAVIRGKCRRYHESRKAFRRRKVPCRNDLLRPARWVPKQRDRCNFLSRFEEHQLEWISPPPEEANPAPMVGQSAGSYPGINQRLLFIVYP